MPMLQSPALHPGAIQIKEGFKLCYLATLQVQSLSEETSSADDGRASSKILTPSNFGSEEEEDDEDTDEDANAAKGGDCEVISRRKILAANGIGVNSTDNLISSPSATTSVSRDSPSTSTSDAGMYTFSNSFSFRNGHSIVT